MGNMLPARWERLDDEAPFILEVLPTLAGGDGVVRDELAGGTLTGWSTDLGGERHAVRWTADGGGAPDPPPSATPIQANNGPEPRHAALRRLPRRDSHPQARCSEDRPATAERFDREVPCRGA